MLGKGGVIGDESKDMKGILFWLGVMNLMTWMNVDTVGAQKLWLTYSRELFSFSVALQMHIYRALLHV